MIKIQRVPEPSILRQKSADWTNELCEARRQYYENLGKFERGELSGKPTYPRASKSRYAHQEIKTSLKAMFGAKCAYCESEITPVSYPHVEHFRPQSIYPKLAYDWDNLLLACEVCNSGKKSDQFPLEDGRQPQEDKNSPCSLDNSDDNALVNPCVDNPEDFFRFEDEWIICLNDRARKTRDVCGLNREDLRDKRKIELTKMVAIAKAFMYFKQNGIKRECREFAYRIRPFIEVSTPYSMMIRTKLVSMGIDLEEILSLP